MNTDQDRDTTQTANTLRTLLGWLEDNRDTLPAGASVTVNDLGRTTLTWHTYSWLPDLAEQRIAHLTAHYGQPTPLTGHHYRWATWPADEDTGRPELIVFTDGKED